MREKEQFAALSSLSKILISSTAGGFGRPILFHLCSKIATQLLIKFMYQSNLNVCYKHNNYVVIVIDQDIRKSNNGFIL